MEPTTLLRAGYLDIIFDNRNKKYGGYELRKHYNQRIGKSVTFLLLGLGALISFSFITSHKTETLYSRTIAIAPKIIDIVPPKQILKPTVCPRPLTPSHIHTQAFTEPVITENDLVKPEQQMTENKSMIGQPGLANAIGDSAGISDVTAHGTGTGIITQPTNTNKPFVWVEQMPQFVGDMDAYMNSHLKYPEAARATGIEGRVTIGFVVNEDGAVSEARVLRGIGGGCDEEALKMVSGMPKWKPGKQNGNAVKVFFTLPVNFVLN